MLIHMTEPMLDADAAAARLGVRHATLYAYVSRGRIRSEPHPTDPRRSLYSADDVDRIAAMRRHGRSPGRAAAGTLDWGLPVLDSAIALVERGRLHYRGRDALQLAERATLEDVARLIWDCGAFDPFATADPPAPAKPPTGPPAVRCIAALAASGFAQSETWAREPKRCWTAAARLLRAAAAAAIGAPVGCRSIAAAIAGAWGTDAAAADLVRRALVLTADHELNASTFAARVVASTGASLAAAVVAGMAALTGPRHGGMTERVAALLDTIAAEAADGRSVRDAVARRLQRGEHLPGFGHPLYPGGDPRARALLGHMPVDPLAAAVTEAVQELTGVAPNIDFALVALARSCGLPADAPFALFLVGRTVGWIGHALEQQATGELIRPRARYTGVRASPADDTDLKGKSPHTGAI